MKASFKESLKFLYLVSFIEGGAVMGVELSGAKMIEPFFGSSLYTWSSVLAVTLLGLTSGYYLGGMISTVEKKLNRMYVFLLVAASYILLTGLFSSKILVLLISLDIRVGAIISSLIVLFIPLCLFGMVSPIIIRKITKQHENAGKSAGSVYAISTVGGIVFTFLTGFWFIPHLGLRITSMILCVVILIPTVFWFVRSGNNKGFFISLIPIFIVMIGYRQNKNFVHPESNFFEVIHSEDGLFGQLMVLDYKNLETRCLFVNNISQSYMHKPTKRSQWTYVHRLACYSSFKPANSKVFLIGLGAGNVVTELENLGFIVDVCEIDERMAEVAKSYFGYKSRAKLIIDDARHAIKTNQNKYDEIILDVSAGEKQPNNLYTQESFEDLKKILAPSGHLFIHYPSVWEGENGLALKSIWTTMESVGFKGELINTFPDTSNINEYILVGSLVGESLEGKDFSRRDHFSDPFNFPYSENITMQGFSPDGGYVLTDDKPSMDFLHLNVSAINRKSAIDIVLRPMHREKLI